MTPQVQPMALGPMERTILAQLFVADGPLCYPSGGEQGAAIEALLRRGFVEVVDRPDHIPTDNRCLVLTDGGRPLAQEAADDPNTLRDDTR